MKISRALINSESGRNILIILACTTFVYFNALSNGFVWDDKVLLVPNEAYRKLDLIKIFSTKMNSLEYLPFRDLSYALDFSIWGMDPFGFHLTNLIIYLISLVILYRTVVYIAAIAGETKNESIALWTTLIFALHPLHTEVVSFIHGRNTLLAGMFLFISFNLYAKGIISKSDISIFMSAIMFIVAMLSKAIVIFFPFFIAITLAFVPEKNMSGRKKVLILMIFVLLDILGIIVHAGNASATGMMNINTIRYGVESSALLFVKALQIPFFYAKMLIVPYPLNVLYPVSFVKGSFVLRSIAAGTVLFGSLTAAWILRKKYPIPFLAVAWFFLSLVPVLNIFPTVPVVADRYAYFSVLGFALLLSYLLERTALKNRNILYIAAVIIIVMGYLDINRNRDWKSDISLWRSEISVNPDVDKIYMAEALWEAGEYEKALSYLEKDNAGSEPFRYEQYMGKYFYKMGDYRNAILHYQEAINRGGDAQKEIHAELGTIYEISGLDREALAEYLKVTDMGGIDPLRKYEKTALEGIGRIRSKLMPEVDKERRFAEQEPMNFKAQAVYALSIHRLGLYEEAGEYYERALNIDPSSWEAWYNLAITFMKRHRYKEAVMSFERSLSLNQKNKDALNNIGICYISMRDYSQAIKYYEKALSAYPDFFYPAFNLGRIYFIMGKRDMSVKYFSLAKELSTGDPGIDAKTDSYLSQLR